MILHIPKGHHPVHGGDSSRQGRFKNQAEPGTGLVDIDGVALGFQINGHAELHRLAPVKGGEVNLVQRPHAYPASWCRVAVKRHRHKFFRASEDTIFVPVGANRRIGYGHLLRHKAEAKQGRRPIAERPTEAIHAREVDRGRGDLLLPFKNYLLAAAPRELVGQLHVGGGRDPVTDVGNRVVRVPVDVGEAIGSFRIIGGPTKVLRYAVGRGRPGEVQRERAAVDRSVTHRAGHGGHVDLGRPGAGQDDVARVGPRQGGGLQPDIHVGGVKGSGPAHHQRIGGITNIQGEIRGRGNFKSRRRGDRDTSRHPQSRN